MFDTEEYYGGTYPEPHYFEEDTDMEHDLERDLDYADMYYDLYRLGLLDNESEKESEGKEK